RRPAALSFPTRRSSDLGATGAERRAALDAELGARRVLGAAGRADRGERPAARHAKARPLGILGTARRTCDPSSHVLNDTWPPRPDRKSTRLNSSHDQIS